ncbi:MAG: hypothetical protein IJI22_04440 [Bacilli bacterium]|nr:hypothetical protein [Bacilli bacterium]
MGTEYIFDNREYDVGVRNLKATMFDIVASEEERTATLQEKVANEGYEDLQAGLVEVSSLQSACLMNIVRITNELVETMKQLDSCSKETKRIEQESINRKLASVGNSQVMDDPNVTMTSDESMTSEVTYGNNQEQEDFNEEAVVDTPVEEVAADISLDAEPQEEVVADDPIEAVQHEEAVVDATIDTAPQEEVVVDTPIDTAQQEEVVVDTSSDAAPQEETQPEVSNEVFALPVIEADSVQVEEASNPAAITFVRQGSNADRAILVTQKQSTNLRNSKDSQQVFVSRTTTDTNMQPQEVDNSVVEPVVDDKKKQIEEMLEQANALYKEGKTQDAQSLYDEISALNKELQAETQKTLVA